MPLGDEFKNIIVTIDNMCHIADMCNDYVNYYKEREIKEKSKNKSFTDVFSKITYSIEFGNKETIRKTEELDWFKETLKSNAKNIISVDLYVSAYDGNKSENLSLTFYPNRIYINSSSTDIGKNKLARDIENYLRGLPPRYDDVIKKDNIRKILPSFKISVAVGIILSVLFFLLCKLSVIPIDFSNHLLAGIISTAVLLGISIIGGFIIPSRNLKLYNKIKFEQKYVGSDSSFHSIYENDYDDFRNKCEVCISYNSEMDNIRKSITKNFESAKKILLVETALAVVAIILFFVI